MTRGEVRPFRTVLVVDDDRVLARLVSTRLREAGMATLLAHDLPEAQRIVSIRPVDAIVLDLHMPSGSGDELVRQMKELKRTSSIPVVILTGSDQREDAARLLGLGVDAFLHKPPDFPDLLERLDGLMQARAEAAVVA